MKKINMNPKGLKIGDCVIRAISYATNQSWDKVYQDLCSLGLKMKRMPNDKKVFNKYLEQLDWVKQKQPKTYYGKKMTVNEFSRDLATKQIYLISVRKHLTVLDNYELVDIWDCSNSSMGNYWTKRG